LNRIGVAGIGMEFHAVLFLKMASSVVKL
jgi:hypothetical protein